MDPVFPQPELHVTAWTDPVIEELGHPVHSDYVETYWLPLIGPTSVLLIRRLIQEVAGHPDGVTVDTARLAHALGLGIRGGANSPLWRTLNRCHRFGVLHLVGHRVVARTHLAPLTARQREQVGDLAITIDRRATDAA